jgi:hypothetical protein
MKKLDIDIMLKESFYKECSSPMLPIPFSSEDMKHIIAEGVSLSVVADNLLQMTDQHPEKINSYTPLMLHCCLNAGEEAAVAGDHFRSNHYFLLASDLAPDDLEVRQNLARSYQHLGKNAEALDNFLFVLHNAGDFSNGLFEATVCMIECYYAIGEKETARKFASKLTQKINQLGEVEKTIPQMLIKKILTRDQAEEELIEYFT